MNASKAALDLRDLMNIVAELCDEQNLVVSFKESLKGAGLAAAGALLFGLLMGPVGLGVGGAVGGTTGALLSKGKFQPVGTVLRNMSQDKWQKLYERFKYAFRNFHASDAVAIVTLIASQKDFQQLAVTVVKDFLTKELSGTIR